MSCICFARRRHRTTLCRGAVQTRNDPGPPEPSRRSPPLSGKGYRAQAELSGCVDEPGQYADAALRRKIDGELGGQDTHSEAAAPQDRERRRETTRVRRIVARFAVVIGGTACRKLRELARRRRIRRLGHCEKGTHFGVGNFLTQCFEIHHLPFETIDKNDSDSRPVLGRRA